MTSDSNANASREPPAGIVLRWPPWLTRVYYALLAAVLGLAAVAKAVWLPPGERSGLFQLPWLLALVVAVELLAAGWFLLLAHHFPSLTRRLGIGLFSLLALVSLWALVRGEPCQCFGTSAIGPEATLAFDLLAIAALAWMPLPPIGSAESRRRAWYAMPLVAVLAIALAVWAYGRSPHELTPDGRIAAGARAVALRPAGWVGQRLPILDHVEIEADLSVGRWMVVLFRPDCAHCLRLIPKLRERADRGDGAMRLALLDVSAGTAEGSVMGPVGRSAVFGRMKPGTMWIVVPPVGVELVDGQVQRVLDADQLEVWDVSTGPTGSLEGEDETE